MTTYSIALTAASRMDLIRNGTSVGGIGAVIWLSSYYITKGSYYLLEKAESSDGRIAKTCAKVLKAVLTVFEFMKLFSLYGAGVGFSTALAASIGCYAIPSIAVLILGSTLAGVYAISQTQEKLKSLFDQPRPANVE